MKYIRQLQLFTLLTVWIIYIKCAYISNPFPFLLKPSCYHAYQRGDDSHFKAVWHGRQVILFTGATQSFSADPAVCEERRAVYLNDPAFKRGNPNGRQMRVAPAMSPTQLLTDVCVCVVEERWWWGVFPRWEERPQWQRWCAHSSKRGRGGNRSTTWWGSSGVYLVPCNQQGRNVKLILISGHQLWVHLFLTY